MTDEFFLNKIAELSRVPRASLTDSTPINPEEWDSIEVLDLIAAMDESFGRSISTADLNDCKTVGDLRDRLRRAE